MPFSEMERIIYFTGLAMEGLAGGEHFEENTCWHRGRGRRLCKIQGVYVGMGIEWGGWVSRGQTLWVCVWG